jgi:hypothetical protein
VQLNAQARRIGAAFALMETDARTQARRSLLRSLQHNGAVKLTPAGGRTWPLQHGRRSLPHGRYAPPALIDAARSTEAAGRLTESGSRDWLRYAGAPCWAVRVGRRCGPGEARWSTRTHKKFVCPERSGRTVIFS